MARIIVVKKEREGLYCENPECGRRTETHHFVKRKGAVVGLCADCYFKFRLSLGENMKDTGGSQMAKGTKEKKERRTSAADILVPQFGLQKVKSNDELIKMVKDATGSKKFDNTQLAWYKSQYRRGLLKGMNGKAGHVINQGSLTKEKKAPKAKKAAKSRKGEEPIEE